MTRRSFTLATGFVLAVAAASLLDPPVIGRGGVILLILLISLLVALVAVLIPTAAPRGQSENDEQPADGIVPVISLDGVESKPNPDRPGIREFVQLDQSDSPRKDRKTSPNLPLRGRLALFSLFVGRDGSAWSSREISEAYDSLLRMGRWLEKEAASWDAPLNLEVVDTYFAAMDDHEEIVELAPSLDPFENTIDEVDVDLRGIASAGRAAARLGFADLPTLMGQIENLVDHGQTVWFVHMLREGRSRALRADRLALPGVGVALCYAREATASGPLAGLPYVDPVTLTHELLHLFGATDKYGTPLGTFPRRSVTSRDIMRLDHDRLGRLRVDALTAWELGWVASPTPRAENRPASTRA